MSDVLAPGAKDPGAKDSVELPDGRQLAWSRWGPQDGYPVIFCTGAGMSGSLGFGADHLSELGLRLLAIDRPGLGRSTPHPTKTLTTWTDDVRWLVKHRELGPVATVGFSQGAPFAFALAGSGAAHAVAIAAGQDDMLSVRHLLPPDVVAMVDAAVYDPARFERDIAETASAQWLWRTINNMITEQDRKLYTVGRFARAYRRCLDEGFAQGSEGYARDLLNTLGPWPVPAEQISAPVDLWYGQLDSSPVHSPDFGLTLLQRLPDARHHLLPDEGGSILWTRSKEILEGVRELIDRTASQDHSP